MKIAVLDQSLNELLKKTTLYSIQNCKGNVGEKIELTDQKEEIIAYAEILKSGKITKKLKQENEELRNALEKMGDLEEPVFYWEVGIIQAVDQKEEHSKIKMEKEKRYICHCGGVMEATIFDNVVKGIVIKDIPGIKCPKCKENFMKKQVEKNVNRILYQVRKEQEKAEQKTDVSISYPENVAAWEKKNETKFADKRKRVETYFSKNRKGKQ